VPLCANATQRLEGSIAPIRISSFAAGTHAIQQTDHGRKPTLDAQLSSPTAKNLVCHDSRFRLVLRSTLDAPPRPVRSKV
jgi:hypothetical protein